MIAYIDQIEIIPPLELPLRLKLPDGRFCADRITRQTLPDGSGTYKRTWFHGGVDLMSKAGDLVYAVQAGKVVEVYDNPSDKSGAGPGPVAITIHHNPEKLGYISRYLHLGQSFVHAGHLVKTGNAIGRVGRLSMGDHLHLELHRIADPSHQTWDEKELIPIDPTPVLYRCEWRAVERQSIDPPHTVPFRKITQVTQTRMDMIPFFSVTLEGSKDDYHIPLYLPSPSEQAMVALLREAFNRGAMVELMVMNGAFFGSRRIIIHVRLRASPG